MTAGNPAVATSPAVIDRRYSVLFQEADAMFISKKRMPRRTFLHGAGVTLALPLLEAMVPAGTALAQTPAAGKSRFVGVFYPHGMAPGYWEPEQEGSLSEKLPYIAETLEKVKDQTVV